MKNQVKVTANPANGLVFISTGISEKDGKEYGYYRVQSVSVDRSGPIDRVEILSALRGTTKAAFDAAPLQDGEMLDGKILIKESTTKNPFKSNQVAKTAGKDGGAVLCNGLPIYRETEFTTDLSAENILVQHTSIAEVVAKPEARLNS